jgi:hypothetical protein
MKEGGEELEKDDRIEFDAHEILTISNTYTILPTR